jgi:hypothetical protein
MAMLDGQSRDIGQRPAGSTESRLEAGSTGRDGNRAYNIIPSVRGSQVEITGT